MRAEGSIDSLLTIFFFFLKKIYILVTCSRCAPRSVRYAYESISLRDICGF